MDLAYVSTYDARNILNWSGIPLHMAKSFENQSIKIKFIGPLNYYLPGVARVKNLIYKRVFEKDYLPDREPTILKNYAKQVKNKLINIKYDVIFSPGTIPIAYLESLKPIVFWTDSTFAGMLNFYYTNNVCRESIINGNRMEQAALSNCNLAIYSSEWAAKTAIDNYKVDSNKVKIVPFGANMECNRTLDDVKNIVKNRNRNICKLLFIGKEWKRKGGDVALQILKELNKQGIKTELTIIGCEPESITDFPDCIKVIGFLNKNVPEHRELLNKVISESHFLVLPSVADASPIVFCEANSFGIPCITTNVGGITTVIRDGINGQTFPLDAQISEYCDFISTYFLNYSDYEQLALRSYNEYVTRLNWDVAGEKVKQLIEDYCY